VLILFFSVVIFFISKEHLTGFNFYTRNIISFFLFLENWSFSNAGHIYENHLQHFWSLAVEEQFYLLWPLFIYFFFKNKHLYTILYICIACIIIGRSILYFESRGNYPVYFYNTFCRMDSFIIGGLLYFFSNKIAKLANKYLLSFLILTLITGVTFYGTEFSNLFMSTIGYTLLAIAYSIIIYVAIRKKNNYLKSFFNQQWIIFFGKISYGLYIFHWIILRFLEGKIIQYLDSHFLINETLSSLISLISCLLISILLSIISYFYFEMYFLKKKVR
jgi:peptidoglycan/LPS O-acetylase OafA/YrhL